MINIEKSILVDVISDTAFDVICDFERYPDFLPEVEGANIVNDKPNSKDVFFTINFMRRVEYTLRFNLKNKDNVTWKLIDGDGTINDNSGFWSIEKRDGSKSKITYHVNLNFNMQLPTSIAKAILGKNVEKMLERFRSEMESAER